MITIPLWVFVLLLFLAVPMAVFIIGIVCALLCIWIADMLDEHEFKKEQRKIDKQLNTK